MLSAHPASSLDVFGARWWLPHHRHEAEPVHIEADGDHVRGQDNIERFAFGGYSTFGELGRLGHVVARAPAREVLRPRVDLSRRLEAAPSCKQAQALPHITTDLQVGGPENP